MEEAAPLIAAVHDSKRVVQIGLQQRSWEHFAQARQEIHDGRLGQVTLIRTYWFQNHIPSMGRVPSFDMSKLDWKRFLGSADRPPLRSRPVRQLALVLGFRRRRDDRPFRPLGGRRALDHECRHAHARHRDRPEGRPGAAADAGYA